jgi:hypothetical protein
MGQEAKSSGYWRVNSSPTIKHVAKRQQAKQWEEERKHNSKQQRYHRPTALHASRNNASCAQRLHTHFQQNSFNNGHEGRERPLQFEIALKRSRAENGHVPLLQYLSINNTDILLLRLSHAG